MSILESVAKQRNEMRAKFSGQPRFCTQCRCARPHQGGREIAFNNGRNARWVCSLHGESHGPAA